MARPDKILRNEENPKFKHGLMNNGYKRVNIDGKRLLEHRYFMENKLGRNLQRNETVHHLNHIKIDNRLENLVIVPNEKHVFLHKDTNILFINKSLFWNRWSNEWQPVRSVRGGVSY